MVNDVFEARQVVGEFVFEVLLPEEFGVGEARADDFFVAFAHGGFVGGFEVGNRDEVRADFAVRTDDGEGFLVVLHGGDEDFLRHGEVALVEAAGDGNRPFGEARHFREQRRRDNGNAAECRRFRLDLGADAVHACGVAGDDVRAAQVGFVAGGAGDGDGLRVMDAVAEGFASGLDAEVFKRQYARIGQSDEAQHRADEALFVVAPAHPLGNRQVVADVAEQFGQECFQRLPGLFAVIHQPFAFGRVFDGKGGDVHAAGGGKAQRGLAPVAVFIFGGGECRAFAFDFLVALAGGEVADAPGEAARRGERFDVAMREAGVCERLRPEVASGVGKGGNGFGRQFFDADFNQQGGGGAHAVSPF